ncbi:fatty acid desaturase family protein [Pendulispora albinea]|uniref:Acyl-CoA desaturase n=1 Tax=Pendulispora albinea TaxID=2741071 RepID=A0ABZ2LR33_9BACT
MNTIRRTVRLPVSLDDAEIEEFGRELDTIQNEIKASLGERDRHYILRLIKLQRSMALVARLVIFASIAFLPRWGHAAAGWGAFFAVLGLGTIGLGLAKILENMEIGHNVMHGQWDWMHDPQINSTTWEWDNVCPSDQWKHSHNVVHHTWTNVLGKDRDVGYEILRVTGEQPWHPAYLFQPVYNFVLAMLFEWGVALHDLDIHGIRLRRAMLPEDRRVLLGIAKKAWRQVMKDYVLWPLLAGPFFFWVLGANAVANWMRNVWSYAIIFCGHFPEGVHVFTEEQVRGETRARWYLRQLLGSCNIEGGKLFHVLSGNLSHQIEHHLFPDMPSHRYAEASQRVRALCARYGLPYNSGSLARQFGTTTAKIFRFSLPSARGAVRSVVR